MSVLAAHEGEISGVRVRAASISPRPGGLDLIVVIPTTAGTAWQATMGAVITRPQNPSEDRCG